VNKAVGNVKNNGAGASGAGIDCQVAPQFSRHANPATAEDLLSLSTVRSGPSQCRAECA
jgi:hypothetical protein